MDPTKQTDGPYGKLKERIRPDYAVVVDSTHPDHQKRMTEEFHRIQKEVASVDPENIRCCMGIFVEKVPGGKETESRVHLVHMGTPMDSAQMLSQIVQTVKLQFEQAQQAVNETTLPTGGEDNQQ